MASNPKEKALAQLKERFSAIKKELHLLDEVTRKINSSLKLDEVMEAIIAGITDTIGAQSATLYLVAADGKIDFSYIYGVSKEMKEKLKTFRLEIGEGIVGSVVKKGVCEYIPDAQKDKRFFKAVDGLTAFTTRSILCVPLRIKDRIIGAIQVINKKEGLFDREDLNLLETIATHAAISLDNASLYGALETKEKLIENIVENIEEGVLVLDDQLKVITANSALERMSGGEYKAAAITGRHISTLFSYLGLEDVCRNVLATGDSFEQAPDTSGTIIFKLIPIKSEEDKVENIIIIIKNRIR